MRRTNDSVARPITEKHIHPPLITTLAWIYVLDIEMQSILFFITIRLPPLNNFAKKSVVFKRQLFCDYYEPSNNPYVCSM